MHRPGILPEPLSSLTTGPDHSEDESLPPSLFISFYI